MLEKSGYFPDISSLLKTTFVTQFNHNYSLVTMSIDALFDGLSIFSRLNNSSFGRFFDAINSLDGSVNLDTFTLPRVVVVGSESAGKSSLLENITKCAVFPRARDICTKMPIRLELSTAKNGQESITLQYLGVETHLESTDGILEKVESIMVGLKGTISSDELIIKICKLNAPTFTFIDLPGIRSYPAELKKSTEGLVEKYLTDPHTLVLCVVQASDRLTSNQAIAKIIEMGKQSQSILALTKVDMIHHSNDWETLVMDRIMGRSSELNGIHFAGCAAVVNRMQADDGKESFRLKDMDILEEAWFREKMAPFMADEELIRKAVPNMMVTNLVKKVDRMFHDFICTTWRPHALLQIKHLQKEVEEKMTLLGPKPSEMTCADLHRAIVQQIEHQWTTANVAQITTRPRQGQWGTRLWAEEQENLRDSFTQWFTILTGDNSPYKTDLTLLVNKAFNRDTPMMTARFTLVHDFLMSEMKDTFCTAMVNNLSKMRSVAGVELDLLLGRESKGSVQGVASTISGMVMVKCVLPALRAVQNAKLETAMLVEAYADAEIRLRLEQKLECVKSAAKQIEVINDTFND